jgi:hypothetical protein
MLWFISRCNKLPINKYFGAERFVTSQLMNYNFKSCPVLNLTTPSLKIYANLTVGQWVTDMSLSPLKHCAASISLKLISLPQFLTARYCNYLPQLKELIKPCKGLIRVRTWTIGNTLYSDPLYRILPKWGNMCGKYVCKCIHALKALHQILWSLQSLS